MSGLSSGPIPGDLPPERSTASHPAVFPKLAIIVPCFNEEECLAATLNELLGVLAYVPFAWEVIVVDDGSRDRSVVIAEEYVAKDARVRSVKHRVNMGSGQAIWTGIQAAQSELVIYVPADGQFDHGEIPDYVAKADEGADIVIGHRLSRDDYTLYRRVSSVVFLGLCNTLFEHQFQDVNWVHLWRRSIFTEFEPQSRGVFFLEEILVRSRDRGKKVSEVPSVYRPRAGGQAKGGKPMVIVKTIYEMLKLWNERRPHRPEGAGGGKAPLC